MTAAVTDTTSFPLVFEFAKAINDLPQFVAYKPDLNQLHEEEVKNLINQFVTKHFGTTNFLIRAAANPTSKLILPSYLELDVIIGFRLPDETEVVFMKKRAIKITSEA